MSKFVNGELCENRFGRPRMFLNYVIGTSCIVYNPKRDIFEVLDSLTLKPIDRYGLHRHTVDVSNGINAVKEAFDFKIFELHRKALPIAQRYLDFFKSLEGCTLDLSDSKLEVAYITIGDNESHNWQDLIQFIGVRSRDGYTKRFVISLKDLKPNSPVLQKMVDLLQED